MNSPVFFLLGPTATGKTQLAIELAQEFPLTIISVDSAMIYKGMDIGTGKPDKLLLAQYPHALVDICDPAETYSVAEFCQQALALIEKAIRAQRIPLLVGGTMLYFYALQFGMTPLPKSDLILRQKLLEQLEDKGSANLHKELAEIDPIAAERIHPNDPQRLLRALEVYQLTGTTLSAHLQRKQKACLPYTPVVLGLRPEKRERLHQRISTRFDIMLSEGFVDEVAALRMRSDLHPDLPSMRAVGYRQVWHYLEGCLDYTSMREQAIIATRQLAKRQYTWMRRWQEIHYFDSEATDLMLAVKRRISECRNLQC